MPSRRSALLLPLAAWLSLAGGPARGQEPPPAQERIAVVASFSILADLARQVGGERVAVASLVGPNGDAHVFSPSPADVARVRAARLVVVNGLGFDRWMDRLIKTAGTKAAVVVASKGVKPLKVPGEGAGAHRSEADPHAWHDVANAKLYVANIRDGLIDADPAGRDAYAANAAAALAQLDALDAEVKAAVARIPPERRRVVTTHDAFAYFAKAYDIPFIAPQGVSTEAEASARDVALIVRQIRRERAPAVFLENVSDPRLIEQIARESGAKVGGQLFSDALSDPGGPAGTYQDLIRHNVRALSAALGG